MDIIALNFSNIYPLEDFVSYNNSKLIDLNIEGTNCYCDENAETKIKEIISNEPLNAIHFIDSGNYHYVSKLWTDRIEQEFNLLVFDHHNDMQLPMFGNILSCGGWILKTIEENRFLNKVILIGVRDDLAKQIPFIPNSKIVCCEESDIANALNIIATIQDIQKYPLYISVDKDAFSTEYACTNWDQGTLTLDDFTQIINYLINKTDIIGIDICGEPDNENASPQALMLNNIINQSIIDILNKKDPL